MTAQQHGELDLASVVAARTRGLMAERRMKQGELSLVLGVSRSRISDRLTGAKDFDLNELPVLADALGTSVEYLLGMTDERGSKNPRPAEPDGGVVRHQGLEPRTRWLTASRRHLRLIPAPLPPSEIPSPAAAAVIDLTDFRMRKAS